MKVQSLQCGWVMQELQPKCLKLWCKNTTFLLLVSVSQLFQKIKPESEFNSVPLILKSKFTNVLKVSKNQQNNWEFFDLYFISLPKIKNLFKHFDEWKIGFNEAIKLKKEEEGVNGFMIQIISFYRPFWRLFYLYQLELYRQLIFL